MPYDYAWANEYLTEYHTDLTDYFNRTNRDEPLKGELSLLHSSLVANQGPIRQITEDILGESVPRFGEPLQRSKDFEFQRLVSEALVIVRKKAEMDEHWSSDTIIAVDTDALHPWVWHAAEDLWASDHWGEAVEAALKVINAKLQEKVGRRDISEATLVDQAWSSNDPNEEIVRLRIGDPEDPKTFASRNEGAHALGKALFKLWRNPLAHLPDKMERQRAIEGLAAASAFAAVIEEAEVHRYEYQE